MKKYPHIIKMISGLFWLFCFVPLFAQETTQTDSLQTHNVIEVKLGIAEPASHLVTVKGYIRDAASKTPLLGAKVQSKDQKYSAMTNEEGFFTIRIPGYLNQVSLSAPGYAEMDYPLQGRQEIDASLYLALPSLRNQSALTADAEIQSLLGGNIRVITHSGAPAIGASMFIRGYNSLNAGSQPLIVVDGTIFDNQYDRTSIHDGFILNPLSNISVDDIEEVEILKDGTSLYGAKGGNGVLLIKTKRGKDPVTSITASLFAGSNMRPKTTPLLNAAQFRVYVSDMLKGYYKDPSRISSFPFFNDDPLYYDYLRYHNDNDWTDDVYRDGFTQSYNVGVGGGDDVALYHLSIGYTGANSTLIANSFSRFNARFNSDVNLTPRFLFSFDLSYSQIDRSLRDDGFDSSEGIITSPGALAMIKSPTLIPYEYSNSGNITKDLSDVDDLGIANPLAIIDKGKGESSQNYLSISVRPSYRIAESLKLSGEFNFSLNNMFEQYFRPDFGVPGIIILDSISINHPKGQNAKQISLYANMYLNWRKQYNIHTLDLTGGARFLSDSYKSADGSGHNTPTDLNPNLSSSLKFRNTDGNDDRWRSFSWYANAGYSLYDKYTLSAIVSADASSRFGVDADLPEVAGVRWGIFPSVNAAWLISSENFMEALPFINFMKLRAGYGLSGNDNISVASAITYFSTVRFINEYSALILSNIGNTSLKMETVKKQNAGLDLRLFNNRLSLSGDLFHHTTSDLLTLKQLKYIAGLDYYWANGGKLENRGYEISFDAKALVLNNFQWELGGSAAHYKNKLLELPDGDYTTKILGGEVITSAGNPAGLFYGYKTNGVFATAQEAQDADLKIADRTGVGYIPFTAGDMQFVDLRKDGIIDENDKTVIGDPNPDFTGSFNTRLVYKKLSLIALFNFSYGNDVYNYARSQMEGGYNLYNQSSAMLNRWVNEGQQTSIPKIAYGDPMGNSRFSDRWIEDGSYLRFKSLTLAYEVPVNSIFLSGFTIWASANNLWIYTKYLGSNPEFSIRNSILYQGIDSGLLSQGRSYFIGLKLNL